MYNTAFYLIIAITLFGFILDYLLNRLNLSHAPDHLPEEVNGIYDEEEYRKSRKYKAENIRFSNITSVVNTTVMLVLFFVGFFGWFSDLTGNLTGNYILFVLLFFGMLGFAADLLNTPFSVYDTFVIEAKYGFNRTTPKRFAGDKIKGWMIGAVIGGGLLSLVTWIWEATGNLFWLIAWGVLTVFSLFMSMFYSNLIVPLFNKQTPLEEGELRNEIERMAEKTGFRLDNVYVIDGSKRSSKANAYFTGLGPRKRIVLYDTLINELSIQEIVAVLAHEIGHYKHRHTTTGLILSILQTGLTLFLFSLFIRLPEVSLALGGREASFHLGLIAFGVIYSPVSLLLGIGGNLLSRRHEYQADAFASKISSGDDLVSALKKLSKTSLSNLTPHPLYVFFHYSHPTLLQRIRAINSLKSVA
ncbi:MAG: M48 family metallopeptidase [Bacteroidota bacterium]